ncbi:MAG: cyclically-permuted mutarotase family protein [Clostridiales bacterium]|nr:cyclically-permuted mutarotase family protein [Clostridiales bacterium]
MKMKRLTAMVLAGILMVSMAGCAGQNDTAADNTDTRDGSVSKILWEFAGDLAPQEGMETNKGTAGMLSGVSNGYIVVGGGANFPEDGPALGGTKKSYPDIYVLKQEDGQLVEVNHTTLDHEISYGASITTDDGIYYVGGSTAEGKGNQVLLVKADDAGEITVDTVGELPFTFSDGFAALKNDVLYVGAGKMDGQATNRVFSLDLNTKKSTELAAMPNEATRTQCVSQLLGDSIYVFSGGDQVAYTDGYRYSIEENEWEQVSDVQIGNEKISLLGANSVKLNEHSMLVVGGFNKDVYDNAVAQMAELKDEALNQFKLNYFGADPSELQWNRKVLVYDADADTWTSIGEVPFDAPCGEALILDGDRIYSINGEIKPGTRTKHMYSGILQLTEQGN